MKKTVLILSIILATLVVSGCGFDGGACCGAVNYTPAYIPSTGSCCGTGSW